MKLYEVENTSSVAIFFFGEKKPQALTRGRTRRIAGFRVSEQRGGLYLEAPHGSAYLVKGGRVVLFFGTLIQDRDLEVKGALEVLDQGRGKCAILAHGAEYIIYTTGGRTKAWEGVAGKGQIKRGVHPLAKEVE